MSNSPRGLAGLRQRMTRTEPKHANPEYPASPVPSPTPTDSGELPIPLRPDDMRDGDHIDLRVTAESQEHLFAYEPGAPLPARSRTGKPPAPAPVLPAASSVPPVTGADAIIASSTAISPVSGTYLVSAQPVEPSPAQAQRPEAAEPRPYTSQGSQGSQAPAAVPDTQHRRRTYQESEGPSVGNRGEPGYRNDYREEPDPRPAGRPRPEQPGQPVYDTRRRPAAAAEDDGSGYGTPPPGRPAAARPVTPARPVSPRTEPLDLGHLQGRPASGQAEGTLRRRTDQSADGDPARPAEGQSERHLGTPPAGPVAGPARRSLGPGPDERPGTELQLRPPRTSLRGRKEEDTVTNIDIVLKEAMQIDGAIGVALVDYTSGMTLGQAGGGPLNLEVAAAGNTEVVRAKLRTMEALGLREGIEDILITLDTQYHLIRLITDQSGIGLFLYLALDKHRSNLALARRKLANLERTIEI